MFYLDLIGGIGFLTFLALFSITSLYQGILGLRGGTMLLVLKRRYYWRQPIDRAKGFRGRFWGIVYIIVGMIGLIMACLGALSLL